MESRQEMPHIQHRYWSVRKQGGRVLCKAINRVGGKADLASSRLSASPNLETFVGDSIVFCET